MDGIFSQSREVFKATPLIEKTSDDIYGQEGAELPFGIERFQGCKYVIIVASWSWSRKDHKVYIMLFKPPFILNTTSSYADIYAPYYEYNICVGENGPQNQDDRSESIQNFYLEESRTNHRLICRFLGRNYVQANACLLLFYK